MTEEGNYHNFFPLIQKPILYDNNTDGEACIIANSIGLATGANQSAVADDFDEDGT